jgi:hypothetical protein
LLDDDVLYALLDAFFSHGFSVICRGSLCHVPECVKHPFRASTPERLSQARSAMAGHIVRSRRLSASTKLRILHITIPPSTTRTWPVM